MQETPIELDYYAHDDGGDCLDAPMSASSEQAGSCAHQVERASGVQTARSAEMVSRTIAG